MAYAVNVTVDFVWIADGVGSTMLGQYQSNQPGYGTNELPGEIAGAQTLQLRVAEVVPGGDTPTLANFNTALTSVVSDLAAATGTPIMSQAGAYGGSPSTPLALIQGWATGNP
jgi:hypothetical protein